MLGPALFSMSSLQLSSTVHCGPTWPCLQFRKVAQSKVFLDDMYYLDLNPVNNPSMEPVGLFPLSHTFSLSLFIGANLDFGTGPLCSGTHLRRGLFNRRPLPWLRISSQECDLSGHNDAYPPPTKFFFFFSSSQDFLNRIIPVLLNKERRSWAELWKKNTGAELRSFMTEEAWTVLTALQV